MNRAILAVFLPLFLSLPVRSAERPNIVLIITDQQHAKMMSCAGNPYLKTPAMDRLAARGIRFERTYCVRRHRELLQQWYADYGQPLDSRYVVTETPEE